ncbi:hypothetical protein [Rhizobium leguminosarum]|uniref:hypothetical protein n=1 Tax=Rhizobium leguminosarum TaxID=384 RepID=UPI0013EEBE96|nr:hypothetical protein [Rhizobium leguminosarum]
MFTIRFVTERYAPGQTVTLRWAHVPLLLLSGPNWAIRSSDRLSIHSGAAML